MRSSPPKPEADHDACGVGFIAQLGSQGNRDVVERALIALARLSHRGGVDADGLSGDGAGLLIPIPKDFIRERARDLNIELPKNFGVGMVFIPPGQELPPAPQSNPPPQNPVCAVSAGVSYRLLLNFSALPRSARCP